MRFNRRQRHDELPEQNDDPGRVRLVRDDLTRLARHVTEGIAPDIAAAWRIAAEHISGFGRLDQVDAVYDRERGGLTITGRTIEGLSCTVRLAIPSPWGGVAAQLEAMAALERTRCRFTGHGPLVIVDATSETWHITAAGTPAVTPLVHTP